jgi:hypothetical protein
MRMYQLVVSRKPYCTNKITASMFLAKYEASPFSELHEQGLTSASAPSMHILEGDGDSAGEVSDMSVRRGLVGS